MTCEGTYCPSSGELYDFNRRGQVFSIICERDGEVYDFDLRRHVLSAIWGSARERYGFDLRRHVLSAIWGRAGERYGFDLRGHVLSIIWRGVLGRSVVLTGENTSFPPSGELYGLVPERAPPVHHLGTCLLLYGFDLRCHVLSTIWGRAGELYGASHRRCNHYPVRAIIMLTF